MIRKHRVTFLAPVLVIAAIAAPAASARPIDQVSPQTNPASVTRVVKLSPSQAQVPSATSDQGFDWGDAGIGAGAAFALTAIGIGGALLILSNRRHHVEQPGPTA
jgi:hypothetical protein